MRLKHGQSLAWSYTLTGNYRGPVEGQAQVEWLRDGLQAIRASGEVQALAESVPDSGGVMFVPAFTGLGAPWWEPDARGAVVGLTDDPFAPAMLERAAAIPVTVSRRLDGAYDF